MIRTWGWRAAWVSVRDWQRRDYRIVVGLGSVVQIFFGWYRRWETQTWVVDLGVDAWGGRKWRPDATGPLYYHRYFRLWPWREIETRGGVISRLPGGALAHGWWAAWRKRPSP